MRWIQLFSLMLITVACTARDEDENEISPPPPINLDSNLRRALLKALTELENEENAKLKESQEQPINHPLPHIDISDKIVEKASASALSFYTHTGKSTISTTEKISSTTEEETERPVVIIQRSSGIQSKPISSIERSPSDAIDPFNDAEQILTSASSSFAGNSIKSVTKSTTKAIPTEVTTILPTTSTEENEAKVEDVQFFSAPLVAAFTVHQDESGLPKSVVPIYKQTQNSANKNQIQLHDKLKKDELLQQQLLQQQQQISLGHPTLNPEQYRNQLVLQEKHRALEEEIVRLRQQQQQQDYLLRQQQIVHEQQLNAARSREQIRNQYNQQPFVPITSPTVNKQFNNQNNFQNQFNSNESRSKGAVLSFQPSITLEQANRLGTLPLNGQILPVKNSVDFRTPFLQSQQFQQFPSLTEQRPPFVHNIPTFNIVQSFEPPSPLVQIQSNRVFRHENGVGNFGTNNFDNGFKNNFFGNQQQNHQTNNNRFFRSNLESSHTSFNNFNRVHPPVFNQQLNNLLYNSGIVHGRPEDLNIVSKVLSLNHLGGDYQFANSNVNVQRVPAPSIKKV